MRVAVCAAREKGASILDKLTPLSLTERVGKIATVDGRPDGGEGKDHMSLFKVGSVLSGRTSPSITVSRAVDL